MCTHNMFSWRNEKNIRSKKGFTWYCDQLLMYIVITLSIGTPYLLTILLIKFEIVIVLPVDASKILLYVWKTV